MRNKSECREKSPTQPCQISASRSPPDGATPSARTRRVHFTALVIDWLFKIKDPVFGENFLYDNHRVARVNVLVFEFTADDFDRAKDHLMKKGPLIQSAYEVANHFLARLRVYARLPQIRTLIPAHDPWQVQFFTDSRELLPPEDGKLREVRGGSAELGVFAFKTDAVRTVGEKWTSPEPYVWDQLLLDAHSLWPNIGSSIVTAFSALETFIAWALEFPVNEPRVPG